MENAINGMRSSKKPTAAELQRRIKQAVVMVEKDSNTKSVYFVDRGIRLVDCTDSVLLQTNFHTHIFQKVTSTGYSKPCLYVSRLIEMALENDCYIKDGNGNNVGMSFGRLMEVLKKKESNDEYNIATYVDWWMFNIFVPLYQLSEEYPSMFLTYYNYMHNVACQRVFLEEHKDGMTNTQFVSKHDDIMKKLLEPMVEQQMFKPMTDEEMVAKEMEAMAADDAEQNMGGVHDDSKD